MTTNEQIQEALKLKKLGYSLREIATELGTSKSSVERWIKSQDTTVEEIDTNEDYRGTSRSLSGTYMGTEPGRSMSEYEYELGKLKLLNSHAEMMADKKLKERELNLMEQEQRLKEQVQSLKEHKIDFKQEKKFKKLTQKQEKIEGQKLLFLKRFKKLISELRDTCQDYNWDVEDVESYLQKVIRLRVEIENFCKKLFIDYEELEIWDTLDWINDIFEDMLDDYDHRLITSGTIDFDFDDDEMQTLEESLKITAFDELCEGIEEFSIRDDEPDYDEEDEDLLY